MEKRLFDFIFSLLSLIILTPFLTVIGLVVLATSKGPVFYRQLRVGKGGKEFLLYKFRTMYIDADKEGFLTVGSKDKRVTEVGYLLRKYKLDELPQIFNILKGDMSFVGPRPEVSKYVTLYTADQRKVLTVRPGLTDYASIHFIDENTLLGKSPNPEKTYVEEIMPAKLDMNLRYIREMGFITDIKIILQTLSRIVA